METFGLESLGIINAKAVYRNLTPAELTEHALRRGEGTLSNTGALVVKTGKYTGRSANDKFIVDTPKVHDEIAWGKVNRPIDKARYDAIRAKVTAYLQGKEIFIFVGFAAAIMKIRQIKRYRAPKVWGEVKNGRKVSILLLSVPAVISIIMIIDVYGNFTSSLIKNLFEKG